MDKLNEYDIERLLMEVLGDSRMLNDYTNSNREIRLFSNLRQMGYDAPKGEGIAIITDKQAIYLSISIEEN